MKEKIWIYGMTFEDSKERRTPIAWCNHISDAIAMAKGLCDNWDMVCIRDTNNLCLYYSNDGEKKAEYGGKK